jgi:hypothetical protein
MSFAPKPNKPDSKDAAKLRAEYQKKAKEFRDSRDAATKARLKDEKQKAFQRVVEHQIAERRESLAEVQRVFARMGKFKTDDQIKEERAKAEAARAANVAKER